MNSHKILVVEDDEGLRHLIMKQLHRSGFSCQGVGLGSQALEALKWPENWIVLLDQKLPDMSGKELIQGFRAQGQSIPFVVMTGQGDETLAVEMMKLGALDYLVKTIDLTDRLPGVFQRVLAFLENEQQLQTARKAQAEAEDRYRRLFETMNQGVVYLDPQGRILSANPRAEEILKISSEAINRGEVLNSAWPTIHEDGSPFPVEDHPVSKALATGKSYSHEIMGVLGTPGTPILWISVSATPLFRPDESKPYQVYATFEDITQLREAEQLREQLQNELLQAQKMESIGQLAGGVAHDFNNMLGVIIGHAELALGNLPPDNPLRPGLQEILKCGQKSANLTRQLLAFARKQPVSPKVLDLNETVEGMLKMLQRLIGEEIKLDWNPTPLEKKVLVDPSQVDQILVNLCVNARDALQGQGRIWISTSEVTLDPLEAAHVPTGMAGSFARITVRDNGCGMTPETKQRIFEPFFTTKEPGKGTGLGLATVYGIVRQNNGFITVDSRPGQGTSFHIHLPWTDATSSPEANPVPATAAPGPKTILLAEDEADLLRMTSTMLTHLGYQVIPASGPHQALELAQEAGTPPDLLLSDMIMPQMTGQDLAKTLKVLFPQMKVLFTSGYAAEVLARRDGPLDPSFGFIQKPFSIQELAQKLRQILGDP